MLFELELILLGQYTQYIAEWDRFEVTLCNFKEPENIQYC